MTTIDKIQKLMSRERVAQAEYDYLVQRMAHDDDVPVDEIENILRSASKTAEKLAEDVEQYKRIGELHMILNEEPALREEQLKVSGEYADAMETIKAKRTAVEEESAANDAKYQTQMRGFQLRRQRINDARKELDTLIPRELAEGANPNVEAAIAEYKSRQAPPPN